jgi:hypothetical protein
MSHPKRPRDPNQLAKSTIDIATGQTSDPTESGFAKRAKAGGANGDLRIRKGGRRLAMDQGEVAGLDS